MQQAAKRRPGRPAKSPEGAKRNNLTIRIHDKTRAALDREAAENGWSLSEEAEARIQRTFVDGDYFKSTLSHIYGPELADLLLCVGDAMKAVRDYKPFNLLASDQADNPWRYDQMVRAALYVLDNSRPSDKIVPPRQVPIMVPSSITDPEQRAAIEREFGKPAEAELNMGVNLAKRLLGGRNE